MNNNKLLSDYIKQKIYLHRHQTYSDQEEVKKQEAIKQQQEIKEKQDMKQKKINNFIQLHEAIKNKQIQDEKKLQEEERLREQERIKQIKLSREEAMRKHIQKIKLYQDISRMKQNEKDSIVKKEKEIIDIPKKNLNQQINKTEHQQIIENKKYDLEFENLKLIQQEIELENSRLIQQEIENEKNRLKNQDVVVDLVVNDNVKLEENLDTIIDNNLDLVVNDNLKLEENLDTIIDNNLDLVVNDNLKLEENLVTVIDNNLDLVLGDNIDEECNSDIDKIKFLDEIEDNFIENNKNNKYEYLKNINNADYIRNVHIDVIKQIKILKNYNDINKYFESLKKIHIFTNDHFGSIEVILLEGYIVKKMCKKDSHGVYLFNNEVKALSKICGYPHFPYLLSYDSKKLIIYMTYCGDTISSKNIPDDIKQQLIEIKTIMKVFNINSNDMIKRNICCLGDEIKIIDFGLANNMFSSNINNSISKLELDLLELYKHKKHNQSNDDIKCTPYSEYYPNWFVNINIYNNFLYQLNPYKEKKTNSGNNNKIKRK